MPSPYVIKSERSPTNDSCNNRCSFFIVDVTIFISPFFFFAEGLALSRSQRYRIKRRGTIQKTISFWKNSHMFTRKVVCIYCLRSRPSNLLWRLSSKSAMSQRFDQWWIEPTVCTSFLLTKHPGEKKASALPGELKIVLWLNWRENWWDFSASWVYSVTIRSLLVWFGWKK